MEVTAMTPTIRKAPYGLILTVVAVLTFYHLEGE